MTVISVNSASHNQTAPTAIFSSDGVVIEEVNINEEQLIVYNFEHPEITFGHKGRMEISSKLLNEYASRTKSLEVKNERK